MCWIVVENFIIKTVEFVVVYNEKYTERAIIQFICSDIAGKLRESLVNIFAFNRNFSFFPPLLLPSSVWSPMEQIPDDHAINAMRQPDRAGRLRQHGESQVGPPGGYIDNDGPPDR